MVLARHHETVDDAKREVDRRHDEAARRELVAAAQRRGVEANLEEALDLARAAQDVRRAFAQDRASPSRR